MYCSPATKICCCLCSGSIPGICSPVCPLPTQTLLQNPAAVWNTETAVNLQPPPHCARARQRQPEQPEGGHSDIIGATAGMHTQNCSQFLPVVFSNFANYYSVPVRSSTRQSCISSDGEKCIFRNGIKYILLQRNIQRNILRY